MNKKIGVALFGYGTVGKGVYTLINELDKSYNVKLLKVFDLPDKKDELKDLLETDYNKIITDPSIDIIIECLGGDTLAYKIISQALAHSKSVISSNKETISNHFDEYISLAKANNCAILFEASWWSYRFNARENNAGWRIDYFLVSKRIAPKIVDVKIHNEILGSDHCPIELDIDI